MARAKGVTTTFAELGRTQTALNSVIAQVDAESLAELSRDPAVLKISPVVDYQLDLSETVPFIGGTAVQGMGAKGAGITVAVLDSGIDYTHAALGGPGTALAYENAYGTKLKHEKNQKINDAYKGTKLYPTAKVVGGCGLRRRVVGWWRGQSARVQRSRPRSPAARARSRRPAMAPTAPTLRTSSPASSAWPRRRSCSRSRSAPRSATACSGIALIQGMDFAIDPNGDGATADAADIINMSLGSSYGPAPDDDLSAAVQTATDAGTLVVASAGNSGDKPFIVGSPSSAPAALSVAQTAVPSSTGFAMLLSTGGAFTPREAVFQSWSKPLTAADAQTNVAVQYGDGAGGNLNGCAAFAAGSLAGKVVLVDRGACTFTLKIANIAGGGGVIGVIGLITPGDPFDGSFSAPDCPNAICEATVGYMVSEATSTAMKSPECQGHLRPGERHPARRDHGRLVEPRPEQPAQPDQARDRRAGRVRLRGRGLRYGDRLLRRHLRRRPDGRGLGGPAPGRIPDPRPARDQGRAHEHGRDRDHEPALVFGGGIAAITRIGGGEVRVDRAYASPIAAWVEGDQTAALGFGFQDVTGTTTLTKTVRVRNYSGTARTYAIQPTFRYERRRERRGLSLRAGDRRRRRQG